MSPTKASKQAHPETTAKGDMKDLRVGNGMSSLNS